MEFILASYPKLRDAGGFELLKISGTTRNRHLSLIPCPNQGYTVTYLKDPVLLVNHSIIYIRPLQRNLNMDNVSLQLLFYFWMIFCIMYIRAIVLQSFVSTKPAALQ